MKTLFLLCALALPVGFGHPGDSGGHNIPNRDAFLEEWQWLREMLERMYPGSDFMIIHNEHEVVEIEGWEWVPFFWREHTIYRRPLQQGA